VKLEVLVSRVAPDEGMIVDENQRQWHMVEVRRDESGEPYWQIETKVQDRLIQGIFDDVCDLLVQLDGDRLVYAPVTTGNRDVPCKNCPLWLLAPWLHSFLPCLCLRRSWRPLGKSDRELEGYTTYAETVKYRLIPGTWYSLWTT
jgi:hypothetical protein